MFVCLPVSLPHARQTVERDVIQWSAAAPEIKGNKRKERVYLQSAFLFKQYKTQERLQIV